MNEWKTVRLGDVCEIVMGTSPEGNTISQNPSDGIEFHQGKTCFGNLYLNESGMFTNAPVKFAEAGNVIMSVRAPVGDSNITPRKIAIGRGLCTFNTKTDFEKLFLYYYLNSQIEYLKSKSTGSTFKAVNKDVISDLKIPLPPLAEQKHIAAILDKTQKIITEHKQMLQKYDTLIKSRFIEMFGDNNFQKKKWNEIFITKTGKLDSNAMVEDGEYPFFTCAKEVFKIDKYAFDQEALLLAGNNAAGKYDVKHYKGKFNAYQRTYVLSLKEEWEYPLFKYQLEDKLEYLRQQSLGGLTKYLTLKILETLDFIVPPIELQKKFTTFVQQIDKSKSAVQKSLEKTETLYKALMQQYFG